MIHGTRVNLNKSLYTDVIASNTMELTEISHNMNCAKFTESSEVNPIVVNSVKSTTVCELENYNINSKEWEDLGKNREFLEIVDQIKEIAGVFEKWINFRLDTICSLRNVANYIGIIRLLLYHPIIILEYYF